MPDHRLNADGARVPSDLHALRGIGAVRCALPPELIRARAVVAADFNPDNTARAVHVEPISYLEFKGKQIVSRLHAGKERAIATAIDRELGDGDWLFSGVDDSQCFAVISHEKITAPYVEAQTAAAAAVGHEQAE